MSESTRGRPTPRDPYSGEGIQRLTAWPDPTVDQAVRKMLAQVVDAVQQQMGDDLLAILLTGGFGRGEGSVRCLADGSIRVVNDFDIELVYRSRYGAFVDKLIVQWRHRRALGELAERLAGELAMKQVDLTLRPLQSLRVAPPCRLADFDLQHGHGLLWGTRDPCEGMPALSSGEIDPFEGTWLLRNRGIGLVLARLYLDAGPDLAEGHRENFEIELQKAWLAMGDALWILAGGYHVSYERRAADADRLASLDCPIWSELLPRYRQAVLRKLRPAPAVTAMADPAGQWQEAAQAMVRLFVWYETRRLARPIASLADWMAWADTQPRPGPFLLLRRWVDRRLGTLGDCPPAMAVLRIDRLASVGCSIGLLAARATPVGESVSHSAAAVPADPWRALQRWGLGHDWQALARGLLAALHPGGEVGRFLRESAAAP